MLSKKERLHAPSSSELTYKPTIALEMHKIIVISDYC